jgi:hypothetical protein
MIDVVGKGTLMASSGHRTSLHFPGGMRQDIRWLYADISGDDKKEYVLFNNRQLTAYSDQGNSVKLLFTYKFPHLQDTIFAVSRSLTAKSLIGGLNIQRQELYLLDGNGRLLPGFPVAANRPAVWGAKSINQFVLVTGIGRDVVAYGR